MVNPAKTEFTVHDVENLSGMVTDAVNAPNNHMFLVKEMLGYIRTAEYYDWFDLKVSIALLWQRSGRLSRLKLKMLIERDVYTLPSLPNAIVRVFTMVC